MRLINTSGSGVRRPAAAVLSILLLACIGLSACGGSSSSTTSTSTNAANTNAATTRPGAGGPGGGAGRFATMRACLQKNGVTLPQRPAGARTPGVPGFGRGGRPQLPKGVTQAQFQAALKKCGGSAQRGGFARTRFGGAAFRAAFTSFATCMRKNGIKLPAPNSSGAGPVFNTKGINTTSSQFRTASAKCRSVLSNLVRRLPEPGGASSGHPSTAGKGSNS